LAGSAATAVAYPQSNKERSNNQPVTMSMLTISRKISGINNTAVHGAAKVGTPRSGSSTGETAISANTNLYLTARTTVGN